MFLFTPYYVGELHLKNRIVMAPMTRCRTPAPAFEPGAMTVEYYAQRASAGLIISEGIVVSAQARGYSDTPGLYNPVQEAAWRPVTQAVHDGGRRRLDRAPAVPTARHLPPISSPGKPSWSNAPRRAP